MRSTGAIAFPSRGHASSSGLECHLIHWARVQRGLRMFQLSTMLSRICCLFRAPVAVADCHRSGE